MNDRAGQMEAELRMIGTPERARHEKAYLKSDLDARCCWLS